MQPGRYQPPPAPIPPQKKKRPEEQTPKTAETHDSNPCASKNNNNTVNISGVSVKYACVCVCASPGMHQDTIDNPSHNCLSVFCAALSAPRPACLSRRARSLQNDILPAKTARIWISEPLIETLWLQIGGAAPPQTPPSLFQPCRGRGFVKS